MDPHARHCREHAETTTTMGVPHVTSFCWCMGLEVGSKCIAVTHLLVSITFMILCSVFAENVRAFVGTVEDIDHLYSTWYKISVAVAVVSVVHIVLALTLLVSIIKRWAGGLRVWAVVMGALLCAALGCALLLCATHGFSGTGSDIFLSFLEGILFFGVVSYCILCVNSYYLMLKSAEDMEGPNKTNY